MPVRLNGLIAVPEGEGPFPVVLVIHGTHPGCPTDDSGVDRWPCDEDLEQANYAGFGYLLGELAGRGYLALAPNYNAEHTFGFGEPVAGERLRQLTDLHLGALAGASAGGSEDFGLPLDGRADVTDLALIGHSRGGEAAVVLAGQPDIVSGEAGYGPVAGVLSVAGAVTFRDPWAAIGVPVATVLAGCDGDVTDQAGQFFFEGPRLAPDQAQWVASTLLAGATHNAFNTILPRDLSDQSQRPDCDPLLDPEAQRAWLVDYAGDVLALMRADDRQEQARLRAELGQAVADPAPEAVLGQPARTAWLAPAADRLAVLVPASPEELTTNALGGAVTAEGVTLTFCPKAFYTQDMEPGAEACRRTTVTVPGQPAHAVLTWEAADASVRLAIPEGAALDGATALVLRVAVDPLSPLNAPGQAQALTVELADRAGNRASVTTRADEPALAFPGGRARAEGDEPAFWEGVVALTDVRMPLAEFGGVDPASLAEVAIRLDRTPSGALFLADIALVRG
jgi:dienelactone hydrolase